MTANTIWFAFGGDGNTIATSSDGNTWTGLGKSVFTSRGYYGAYANNLWVAVGQGGNGIATSTDGVTWTGRGIALLNPGRGVAYGNGLWVAVGGGSSNIATSPDGVTWTGRGSVIANAGYKVAYANGIWVAVGDGANTIATSTNGTTWTGRGNNVFNTIAYDVAYANGLWVAVGSGGNTIATSVNGTTWTGLGQSVLQYSGRGVRYANGLWVAVGDGNGNTIATSVNGTSWTGRGNSVLTSFGEGVGYGNGLWVATAAGANTIATSTNGTTWTGRGNTIFNNSGYGLSAPTVTTTVLTNFSVPAKNLGDANFTITPPTTNNTSGAFTYTSSNTAVATVTNNIITIIGMGSTTITAVQASTVDYTSATTTAILVVDNVRPTVTNFSVPVKTVGDEAFTLVQPTSNSSGAFTYTSSNTEVATIVDNIVTIVGGGTSTISAIQASTADYASLTITATLTVSRLVTTLSNFVVPAKTFGDVSFAIVPPTTNSTGVFSYTSSNTAVATIVGNMITIVGTGSSTITATQAINSFYTSATTTATLTVSKAAAVLTNFSIPIKTFGNSAFIITAPTTNSNGAITYTSSNTAVATVAGTVITIVGAGSSTITASQATTANFLAGTTSATFTVNPATTVLSNFSIPTKTFGNAAFSITTPTTNGNGTFTYTSSNTAVSTIAGNVITIVGAGTSTITAIQSSTTNYTSATTTATFTVNQITTVLTNFSTPPKTFADVSFTLTDPLTNGFGEFTYTSSNTSVVTIVGKIVTIVGLGDSTITAVQANTTNSTSATITDLLQVREFFENNLWVAAGQGGNSIATSEDGITWTGSGTTVFNTYAMSIGYGNGLWVAGGRGGNSIATSIDGISWRGRDATSIFTYVKSVAYGNGIWVAVGSGASHTIATSTDGLAWTGRGKTIFQSEGRKVVYANNLWVAVGTGNGYVRIQTSTDGISWTDRGSYLSDVYSVAYGNNLWVVVGTGATGGNILATSTDGLVWTGRNPSSLNYILYDVRYANNMWVGIGNMGIMTSDNGTSWTVRTITGFTTGTNIAYSNNLWVACSGNTIFTSPNAITWTSRSGTVFSTTIFQINAPTMITTVLSDFVIPLKNIGDANFTLVDPSSNATGAFTYTSSNPEVATIVGNVVTIVGIGTSTITSVQAKTPSYTRARITTPLVVENVRPVVTDFSVPVKTFGDAPFSLVQPTSNSTAPFTYTSSNTEVATIDGNTVTIVGGGTAIITANQANSADYGSATISATLTVSQATTVLSGFSIPVKTFGNAAFTITAPITNSNGAFTYSSSNTAVATIAGNTITIVGAGAATITAVQASTASYTSETTTATLTVNQATAVLSGFSVPTRTFGNIPFSLVAPTTNSNGAITYSSSNTEVATIAGNIITIVGGGTSTITVSQAGTTNYTAGTTTATFTVNQATTVISYFSVPAKTFGDAPFTIEPPAMNSTVSFIYSTNSTGAITYTSSNTAVATIVGNVVTVVAPGTSTITASQASTNNYTSGTATATLTVSKATTVISNFNIPSKIFGSAPFGIVAPTSNSNGAFTYTSSNTAVATIAGNVITIVSSGSSIITANQATTANYTSGVITATLSVSKITTVLSNFSVPTKIIGNAPFTITPPTTNSTATITYISSNPAVATVVGTTITVVGIGLSTITASQAEIANYTTGSISALFSVINVIPTITNFNMPAKTFGDAPFTIVTPTSNSTGLFTYTSSNTAVASVAGSTITIIGGGTAIISAIQSSTASFTTATVTATLTVSQATTILSGFSVPAKTFGNAAFNLTAPTTNSNGAFTYTSSNTAVATIGGSTVTIVGAGTATITAIQASTASYTSATSTATLQVGQAIPTINNFFFTTRSFGIAPFAITPPSSNSTGDFTYTSSNTAVATVAGNMITIVGLGSSLITATQASSTNYISGTVSANILIIKGPPTLTNFSISDRSVGTPAFTITPPTSNSDGEFTYASLNTTVARVVGNRLSAVGVGSATITVLQAGTANFLSGTTSTVVQVNGVSTVLSITPIPSKAFGDAPFKIQSSTNSTSAIVFTSSNTSVITIVGDIATIVGTGTSTITATQASNATYTSATTTYELQVSGTSTVLTKFFIPVRTFGNAPFTITPPTSNSNGTFTYTSSNTNVLTIAGNVITLVGAGSSVVTATQASTTNYSSATISYELQVNPATPSLSNFSVPAKTIGDAAFAITPPTSNSSGDLTYTSSNRLVATIAGSTITVVGVGTAIITAVQASTTGYTSGTITASLIVSRAVTAISNFSVPAKSTGDAPFAITPPATNSNGFITYTSSNTDVARITNNIITIVGIGTSNITANQAGTTNYTDATTTATLVVSKGSTVLTNFSVPTKRFGDADFSLVPPTTNSNGNLSYASSNLSVATVEGNVVTIIGAGTTTITAIQSSTANFLSGTITATLTVNPLVTVLTNFSVPVKTFGNDAFAIAPPSSNSSGDFTYTSSNTAVATITDNMVTIVGAGTSTITVVQASTSNYTSATTTAVFTVNPIKTVLSNFSIPGKNPGDEVFSIVPPTTNSNGSFSYTSSNHAVATIEGDVVTIVGLGSSRITALQASTTNYTSDTINATLTVNMITTVLSNFSIPAKTTGDAAFALVAPTSNSTGAFTYTSSNLLIATVAGDVVTIVGTGTCTIIAVQASTPNSTPATISASLVVGKTTTIMSNFVVSAREIGNAPFIITPPTTNNNGFITYTSSNTDVATISRNVVTIVGIGTSTITASQPNTANFTAGTITAELIVSQGTPVITNFSVPAKTIGSEAFALVAPTSTSNGDFTYTSSDLSVATIEGNVVTIIGGGSSTITAVQASTTNFASGTINATLTVNKITTVLTNFSVPEKIFGDETFSLVNPTSNSDGVFTYTSSNTAVATVDGNIITIVGGGNTTITAIQESTSSYTSAITGALLRVNPIKTVTSEFIIPPKIIGEDAFTLVPPTTNSDGAFTYTSSNPAVATIDGDVVTIVGLGSTTIKAVQASTANYTTDAINAIFQVKLIRTVLTNFDIPAKNTGDAAFSITPPTSNSTGEFTYTSSNLLVATVAGSIITIVGTGNVTITAFQESTENSTSARTTASLIVNRANNSISWFSVPESSFGSAPFTITPPTTNSNANFTYTSSNTSVATISRNVITIVGIGTSTITASQPSTANYSAGTISALFTVNRGTPLLTNFSVPVKKFGDASFALVAPTSNSDGEFTYASSDPEVATIEGDVVTIIGVGTTTITADQASTTNFLYGTTTATLIVNQITTVLSNFEIPIKTFGDESFTIVPPTTNSDGGFIYTSSNTDVATIDGDVVTIIEGGSTTITAFQEGTYDYTSATITELLQVNRVKTVLTDFSVPSKLIGDGDFVITPPTTVSDGAFTYTSSNHAVATIDDDVVTIVGLGTTRITAVQAGTPNYTSDTIATLFNVDLITTVLSDFSFPQKIAGDEPFTITPPTTNSTGEFTYTSSNRLVATIAGDVVTIVGVGSTTIMAVQASTENSTSATITTEFVVSRNAPVITNFSVPVREFGNVAFHITRPTSNSNGAFTYTSSNTDVATINKNVISIVGVGTSTITAVQARTSNFESGTITTVFEVIKGTAILTNFIVPARTAGTDGFSLIPPRTNSDGIFTYTSSDTDVATIDGDAVTIVGAGTTTITADQSSSENYLSGTINATFVVNQITTVLTNFPGISGAVGNPAFTITPPTTNSDGVFTYTSSRPSVATIDGDVVTIVGGGITTITAVQSSTRNYTSATTTTTLQVSALTTVLSNFNLPTKAVGEAPFAIVPPTTNGDGVFSYTSSNTAIVTIVGNMATIIGAGTATITAIQSSTPNYSSARITAVLTVNKGTPIITFTMPIKEIGMPDFRIIDPSSSSTGAFTYTSSNIKVATIFANTVSIKGLIGNTIVTASQAATTNYNSATATTTFFVNQLSPTLTTNFIVPATRTVGDPTFKLVAPKSNSISPFAFSSSNQAVVKIAKDVVTIVGAGTAIITATQPATKSFGPMTVTAPIQVNPRTTVLINFSIAPRIVGIAPFAILPPTTNSNGAFTYTSSNTEVATIVGNIITIVAAGSSIITASQAGTANFTPGTTSTTLVVNLPTPQVGALLITNKSLTNPSFSIVEPTKPNNNTGVWTYNSSDLTKAVISENTVTLLQSGIVTITASLSSDSLYNSAMLMTTFSISELNVAPGSFVFVRSSEVAATIPATVIPIVNVVTLPAAVSSPANIARFNPKLGTVVEKQENQNMVVNTLCNMFSTANTIIIPTPLLYVPLAFNASKFKTIKIIRPSTATTVDNPLIINTVASDSAVAFFNFNCSNRKQF